jgi:hypothetical protein
MRKTELCVTRTRALTPPLFACAHPLGTPKCNLLALGYLCVRDRSLTLVPSCPLSLPSSLPPSSVPLPLPPFLLPSHLIAPEACEHSSTRTGNLSSPRPLCRSLVVASPFSPARFLHATARH